MNHKAGLIMERKFSGCLRRDCSQLWGGGLNLPALVTIRKLIGIGPNGDSGHHSSYGLLLS